MIEDYLTQLMDKLPETALIIWILIQNHILLRSLVNLDQAESLDLKEIKKDIIELKQQIGCK